MEHLLPKTCHDFVPVQALLTNTGYSRVLSGKYWSYDAGLNPGKRWLSQRSTLAQCHKEYIASRKLESFATVVFIYVNKIYPHLFFRTRIKPHL